jgi:hypothetical protein
MQCREGELRLGDGELSLRNETRAEAGRGRRVAVSVCYGEDEKDPECVA